MKKLFLILMLTPFFLKAQSTDSLKVIYDNYRSLQNELRDLERSNKELKSTVGEISLNLQKCHKQFKTGLITSIISVVVSGAGSVLISDTPEAGIPLVIAGGLGSIIGGIVIIDSHKFIGRAGLTGITINF